MKYFLTFLLLSSTAFAGIKDVVVQVTAGEGTCTGFIVSEAGHLITAKHCKFPDEITVMFPGKSKKATKVYSGPASEDAVVFDIEGDGYEHLDVADHSEPGPVYTYGYGAGNFTKVEGVYVETTTHPLVEDVTAIRTDFPIFPGQSGAPLFNSSGLVIGACSALSIDRETLGNGMSFWIGTSATHAAYLAAAKAEAPPPPPERPYLYCFMANFPCPPCVLFKSAYANNKDFKRILDENFQVRLIYGNTEEERALIKKYGVGIAWPTFRPENGDKNLNGYLGDKNLLGRLAPYMAKKDAGPQTLIPDEIQKLIADVKDLRDTRPGLIGKIETLNDALRVKADIRDVRRLISELRSQLAEVLAGQEERVASSLGAVNELKSDNASLKEKLNASGIIAGDIKNAAKQGVWGLLLFFASFFFEYRKEAV